MTGHVRPDLAMLECLAASLADLERLSDSGDWDRCSVLIDGQGVPFARLHDDEVIRLE